MTSVWVYERQSPTRSNRGFALSPRVRLSKIVMRKLAQLFDQPVAIGNVQCLLFKKLFKHFLGVGSVTAVSL